MIFISLYINMNRKNQKEKLVVYYFSDNQIKTMSLDIAISIHYNSI